MPGSAFDIALAITFAGRATGRSGDSFYSPKVTGVTDSTASLVIVLCLNYRMCNSCIARSISAAISVFYMTMLAWPRLNPFEFPQAGNGHRYVVDLHTKFLP